MTLKNKTGVSADDVDNVTVKLHAPMEQKNPAVLLQRGFAFNYPASLR